jgi:hypothetical protein
MPALIIIFIIGLAAVAFFSYNQKKINKQKELLPLQAQIVKDLIAALESRSLKILPPSKSTFFKVVSVSLNDIGNLPEKMHELSKGRFDDDLVLFAGSKPKLDLGVFYHSQLLPHIIKEEVAPFLNNKIEPVQPGSHSYFVVFDGVNDEQVISETEKGLYTGDGEAFESWQSFQECCNNLLYVTDQWIRENNITFQKEKKHHLIKV